MDLIYAKPDKSEVGVLVDCTLDLAYGLDENEFELTVDVSNDSCGEGYLVYMDKTEYGGVVDSRRLDTEAEKVKYKGRTWHGILERKIIMPDAGKDYLDVSGDANDVLWLLVQKFGLTGVFERVSKSSGIAITHRFDRYVEGYTAIREMLSDNSAKLKLAINRPTGKVRIWAERAVDWSSNEPIDSDQCDFVADQKWRPVNHLVCLGEGNLKDRVVVHLFADKSGNVSQKQTLFGIDEVVEVYDYNNADREKLIEDGTKRLKEYQEASEIEVSLDTERTYDIGDVVTATDPKTNSTATTVVSKKIVKIEGDTVSVDYEVGGYTESQIKKARKNADDASTAIRAADAAAAAAAMAKATADDKIRVFRTRPVPPYEIGDLWVQGDTGDILVCTTAKEE